MQLWPDNVDSFLIFNQIDDQWLCGPGGFYALSNSGIESGLRMLGVQRKHWPRLFLDFRELQIGARAGMAERKPQTPP